MGGLPQCILGYHHRPLGAGTPQKQAPPWAEHDGRYGQQAGSTHPTGMQSCFYMCLWFCSQGGSAPLHAGIHPPQDQRQASPSPDQRQAPPGADTPLGPVTPHPGPEGSPQEQTPPRPCTPPPPGPGTPPPAQCMLGDTGNKRAAHILLECNLVSVSTIIQDLLWVTTHLRTIVIQYPCTFSVNWLQTESTKSQSYGWWKSL